MFLRLILLGHPVERDKVSVSEDLVAVEEHLSQVHLVNAPCVTDYQSCEVQ